MPIISPPTTAPHHPLVIKRIALSADLPFQTLRQDNWVDFFSWVFHPIFPRPQNATSASYAGGENYEEGGFAVQEGAGVRLTAFESAWWIKHHYLALFRTSFRGRGSWQWLVVVVVGNVLGIRASFTTSRFFFSGGETAEKVCHFGVGGSSKKNEHSSLLNTLPVSCKKGDIFLPFLYLPHRSLGANPFFFISHHRRKRAI